MESNQGGNGQTSRSALMSESVEPYGVIEPYGVNGKGTDDTSDSEEEEYESSSSYEEYGEWYHQCLNLSLFHQYIIWNVSMVLFNIITSSLFIWLILITRSSDNKQNGLLSFAIIQTILRSIMNISGITTSKILSKNTLKRNNNALFLFGIASITFTLIFDIIFLIYFNYILYYISKYSIIIRLVWINIIWIIDICMISYLDYKYFRYIQIDLKTEYYRYRLNFWMLAIISISMFIWGITNVLYVMINGSNDMVHNILNL